MHRLRAARFTGAYLLFTVALMMVPKADIPETLFDEAKTQTNGMVVEKAASFQEYRQPVTAFLTTLFAQPRKVGVRRTFRAYAGRSADSRTIRELLCSLLC
jgi:hypothetical protein